MHHKSKIDIAFSDSGDFLLDEDSNDLQDTKYIFYGALRQQVLTRIQSSVNDWPLSPGIGVGLTSFTGLPNTKETGQQIEKAIKNNFAKHNFLRANEYQVSVFPTSKTHIGILIFINFASERAQIRFSFEYSTKDNKVIPRNI